MEALRHAIIGSDQVMELTSAVLASRNVVVDDQILDGDHR